MSISPEERKELYDSFYNHMLEKGASEEIAHEYACTSIENICGVIQGIQKEPERYDLQEEDEKQLIEELKEILLEATNLIGQ